MDKKEFIEKFKQYAESLKIDTDNEQFEKFYNYMNLLIEWNEKINLTAITDPNEIILKHFIDSITINKYIKNNSKILDIGTGAGFPGIPQKIIRKDIYVTLADSLNKRINFLNQVISDLDLEKIDAVHGRAEELSQNKYYRENYDVVVSRAVAPLNVLLEYVLPFCKLGGICISMKGSNIEEELIASKKALQTLGGEIFEIEKFELPNSDIKRNIIIIKKIKETPNKYPRKAGTPSKEPII